jgi:hypothetical protein
VEHLGAKEALVAGDPPVSWVARAPKRLATAFVDTLQEPELSARRLEELDRVAGGVLEQDLLAARPADDLVAERQPRGP